MIDSIAFGSITIDGRRYATDVIIHPDGTVTENWWRKSGHRLTFEDIRPLVDAAPELIVAGTGAYGRMKPDRELHTQLARRGIAFSAAANQEAAARFNREWPKRRVGGCFHLTC